LLHKDIKTRKEREEAVLELLNNDPEIFSIFLKREGGGRAERGGGKRGPRRELRWEGGGEEEEGEGGREERERWDVLKAAEKAKFWKVCKWFYMKQKEFDKARKKKKIFSEHRIFDILYFFQISGNFFL
jgi:hypothetical protein